MSHPDRVFEQALGVVVQCAPEQTVVYVHDEDGEWVPVFDERGLS